MHERSDVTYLHNQPLEKDCYNELSLCDIVVCIIGNSFGTKSSANDLSITMNELNKALEERKIVFVFVAKDVWIENRTYQKNVENPKFVPAAVDDIEIHKYITALNKSVGDSQPIQQFETADDIVSSLRMQFAGLFQSLLVRRVKEAERDNAYDLHEEIKALKQIVSDAKIVNADFWDRFATTVLVRNPLVVKIESAFGCTKSHVLLKDIWGVDELAQLMGYRVFDVAHDEDSEERHTCRTVAGRVYKYETQSKVKVVSVDAKCFNEDGTIIIANRTKSEELVKVSEEDAADMLPF